MNFIDLNFIDLAESSSSIYTSPVRLTPENKTPTRRTAKRGTATNSPTVQSPRSSSSSAFLSSPLKRTLTLVSPSSSQSGTFSPMGVAFATFSQNRDELFSSPSPTKKARVVTSPNRAQENVAQENVPQVTAAAASSSSTRKVARNLLASFEDAERLAVREPLTSTARLHQLDERIRGAKLTGSQELQSLEKEHSRLERKVVESSLYQLTPQATGNQTNGSWFLFRQSGRIAAVFKPRNQARGASDNSSTSSMRKGIPVGHECIREKLAWTLHKHFRKSLYDIVGLSSGFGVPKTSIVALQHGLFGENHDVGSYQKFIPRTQGLDTVDKQAATRAIPEDQLIRAAIFDLLTLNNDRHEGNLLFSAENRELYLIDHGACFPELKGVEDVSFSWMHLPFASKPLHEKWRNWISGIDERAVVKALIATCDKESRRHHLKSLRISSEALLVSLAAIKLLKGWVGQRPELSLIAFARGYMRESIPFLEGRQSNGSIKRIALAPATNIGQLDAVQAGREHGYDRPTDVEAKRKDIGGHFVKAIKASVDKAKKSAKISQKVADTVSDRVSDLASIPAHLDAILASLIPADLSLYKSEAEMLG